VAYPVSVLNLPTTAVDISAGYDMSYALVAGHTLYGWGANTHCEMLTLVPTGKDQVIAARLPGLPSLVALISKGPGTYMACAVVNPR